MKGIYLMRQHLGKEIIKEIIILMILLLNLQKNQVKVILQKLIVINFMIAKKKK